ncbi:MAG: aminopeptidase [Gammaproteobacteria bacterium]
MRLLRHAIVVALVTLGSKALPETSYYVQSAAGHLDLMRRTVPIHELLSRDDIPQELKRRLQTVLELREFASQALALPRNDSYLSYADVERDYVVWNVYATPELSLTPLSYCYPVAGCVVYRGYFSKNDARVYAQKLHDLGYDVTVNGAVAYSTLRWFDDPVLSTMVDGDDTHLATVILHELAHQKLYVQNDTAFNEAFANTVAREGLRRWLLYKNIVKRDRPQGDLRRRRQEFIILVLRAQAKLDKLFSAPVSDARKRTGKAAILTDLRNEYERWKQRWSGSNAYDEWMLNVDNAKIAAVTTYHDLERAFEAVLQSVGHHLPSFFNTVARLGELPPQTRADCLAQVTEIGGEVVFACLRNSSQQNPSHLAKR